MNYSHIKTFFSKLFSSGTIAKEEPLDGAETPLIVFSIHEVLTRINEASTVDCVMKEYANKLVHTYLTATMGNYYSCVGAADETASRLGRDIEAINNDILIHIEACLIDIEHGAVFKDNLSDVFLSCLLNFEQKLESRIAY